MKRIYLFALFFTNIFVFATSQEMSFKVASNQYLNGTIRWDISADNDNVNFKNIKKIVYNLDGFLFSKPIRESSNSTNNFLLTIYSSKDCNADAEVYFINGSITKVNIKLAVTSTNSLKIENTAREMKQGQWEWDAFVTGNNSEIMNIDHVAYQLHTSFKNPYRVVNQLGNINKPFMLQARGWGVFNLKATVYFKNGKIVLLEHVLQFGKIRVDVFYLASAASITKPKAEKIARIIITDNRFDTRVREISDKTNQRPEYNIKSNEIRYEILEEGYTNDILNMLKNENRANSLEKNLIKSSTTEYLSIFIVN